MLRSLLLSTFISGLALAATTAPAEGFTPRHPAIIAHRGFSWVAPENTMIAYHMAWETAAEGAEVDVHLTSDGKVVCLHDANLKRTAVMDAPVREVPWEVVRELDAGSWKSPQFSGEPIPLLSDLLPTIPEGRVLFVEMKGPTEYAKPVVDVIRESGMAERVVVIGFLRETMEIVREYAPELPVMWLIGAERDPETREFLPIDPANAAIAKDRGFIALNVSWRGITEELVAACREQGIGIYVWTVNEPEVAQRMIDMGVDGITTDRPDVMLTLRDGE